MLSLWQQGPGVAHPEIGPKYRTDQIAQWVGRGVLDPTSMSNLPKSTREQLIQSETGLVDVREISRSVSRDGSIKFLLASSQGQFEAVWMPFATHNTLCVSSQTGCQMGCVFCATAALKANNLTASSIVGQIAYVRSQGLDVDRIVFMGMGEPLHNYDNVSTALSWLHTEHFGFHPRKITVSTVGYMPNLDRFWDEQRVSLAISLNGYDDESRSSWMPVGTNWSFAKLMDWVHAHREHLTPNAKRRITFEYIVAEGRDTPAAARKLASAIGGLKVRVNLIPWNAWGDGVVKSTTETALDSFASTLVKNGVWTTVRRSRALDVNGACGQLAIGEAA